MDSKRFMYATILVLLVSVCAWATFSGDEIEVGDSNRSGVGIYGEYDNAGYSDVILYGATTLHPYGSHEVLSGEWGAALYYDGIDTPLIPNTTRHQAMWLTQRFSYPDWTTNSDFVLDTQGTAWDNAANPTTPENDTGQSVIHNNQVKVTIDYEVVTLPADSYSPMGFLEENTGRPFAMPSDSHVILQTYTIKNITPSTTLTNLEFYQLLHSHGNDEYAAAVHSTYNSVPYDDPLASYSPHDSVHKVGNFRYDITQWNSLDSPGSKTHVDYVSFSSTIAPTWYDNDYYRGGHYYHPDFKPPTGTHLHIEDRNLNNVPAVYMDEVCGAMGWALGSLAPGRSASMTIACMVGIEREVQSSVILTKEILNPQDCYSPGNELTYRLTWTNYNNTPVENAVLYDYLPAGVTYPIGYALDWTDPANPIMLSSDPNYKEGAHRYVWNIGTIPANSGGYLDLTVKVNEMAIPGGTLENVAELFSDAGFSRVINNADVCCWSGQDAVYVDPDATGGLNNGTSWQNAMLNLQDALKSSVLECAPIVRVAEGNYSPGTSPDETFAIPDGVSVFGGYAGFGAVDPNERNPKIYKSVLNGKAADSVSYNINVVTMGNNTLLDGFTVENSDPNPIVRGAGVYGNGVAFTVKNCTIKDNGYDGIQGLNGNVTVEWCTINKNGKRGIYHTGRDATLTVNNCWMLRNGRYGIACDYSTPTIENSIVSESSFTDLGWAGVWIFNPTGQAKLHNNTIANNKAAGVLFEHTDPNYIQTHPNCLDMQNCIVYYNEGPQIIGLNPDIYAHYSCIQDCNEPSTTNHRDLPGFAYLAPNQTPDPNNYHLAYTAFCRNRGNPVLPYLNQVDMDAENRVAESQVDIGADEVACQPVSSPYDLNADGRVNMVEFAGFSTAWLTHDPNDPAWLNDPNIADPNSSRHWYSRDKIYNFDQTGTSQYQVDLKDFLKLINDAPWLWRACWLENGAPLMTMNMGGDTLQAASLESAFLTTDSSTKPDKTKTPIVEDEPVLSPSPVEEARTVLHILKSVDESIAEDESVDPDAMLELRNALLEILSKIDL